MNVCPAITHAARSLSDPVNEMINEIEGTIRCPDRKCSKCRAKDVCDTRRKVEMVNKARDLFSADNLTKYLVSLPQTTREIARE